MTRREKIENIIIGTLLCSDQDKNFYESCKCCITSDMFQDETNMRIFEMVSEMNSNNMVETSPLNIFREYGDKTKDIIYQMCLLSTDFCFYKMKVEYNERQWIIWQSFGIKPKYTDVKFDDYVNRFIQLVFEDERCCNN